MFHFHGHESSRLEALLVSEQAVSLGVRLIALDRPGIGRSSANEGYRLLDWPDDVSEVADQLGIGRFAVEGVSAGGVYALACAYKLPHRLTACRLISTVPPAALLRKAGPLWMRAGLSIVERLPVLFRLYLELLPDPAADERAMEKLLLRYASHLSEADRKLLQTAGLRKQLAQQWLRVGGKDPEATVTKQEYWRSAGASNPKRSRLKGYSYGTASRIALCQSPQLVSLPGNCLIASPLSIRRTVIFRFLWSTRRKFSMRSGGKRAGSGWLGMSVAAQTRRRPIRRNPRCLHTVRRVAPSSGGHVV